MQSHQYRDQVISKHHFDQSKPNLNCDSGLGKYKQIQGPPSKGIFKRTDTDELLQKFSFSLLQLVEISVEDTYFNKSKKKNIEMAALAQTFSRSCQKNKTKNISLLAVQAGAYCFAL